MEPFNSSQQKQRIRKSEEQKSPVRDEPGVLTITPIQPNQDVNPKKKKFLPALRFSPAVRRLLPLVGLGVVLGAGAIASGIYAYRRWEYAQLYPQTDHAYITADIYPVASRIAGIVSEVPVNDNQVVSPGTVLLKLDPGEYQVSLNQAKASLELAKQQAALAQEKIKNIANLPKFEPLPAFKNNQANQTAIQNRMQEVQAISRQSEINEQQYKTAQAAIAQKQADLKKAELELSYTNIYALVAGKIGNKNVQVGQRIQPGETLFTIVQQNPWVIAHFPETQLEKIQPGQPVDIKMPAFASRKFSGKVDSIFPTSESQLVLLSEEENASNATPTHLTLGNQDNVQRIPVKIVFEPASIQGYESRITPGMSAIVTVATK